MVKAREYSDAQRSQIIILVYLANIKPSEVVNLLGIPSQSVHHIITHARLAGYDRVVNSLVEDRYIIDKSRSG
jgi:DNA-directed RNA polymerase specialized sigma24 family protein